MPAFDVVIFDYDGTLCDTRPAIVHCLKAALARCGRTVPSLEILTANVQSGLSLEDTFRALEPTPIDPAALDKLVAVYREIYLRESAPFSKAFPGLKDVLQQLHARGIKCLIVSNKGAAAICWSLERDQLTAFVDLVLGDQPGIPRKPDLALLTDHILPKYPELRRERILMVGDTEIDIQFAKSAGIACCWAAYGYGDEKRCWRLEPEHRIDSIAELPALI